MERKTLLIFNSVAVATTMLASAARADDSGRSMGTNASPSYGAQGSSMSSPSSRTGAAPVTPGTSPSSPTITAVRTTTISATQGTPPVGTTRLTSSDAAIMGSPSTAPSRDTVTVYRKTRPNTAMLVTGATILTATYVPTAVVAAESDRSADKNLYIPIVGPWLNLADRQCSGCDNETRNVALVVGSGVLQGLGAGLAIASFFVPKKIEAATIQAGNVKMNVVPTQMGRGGAGIGAVGTF